MVDNGGDRKCSLQDVPIIGIAITVVAGFHNDFPCKLVLFPEQPRNLRLHLVKGKGIEHGGEILSCLARICLSPPA